MEMGITEQNMASLASGMAAVGKGSFHFFLCDVFSGPKLGTNKDDHLLQ